MATSFPQKLKIPIKELKGVFSEELQKTYHLPKNAMRTKLCNHLDLNMLLSILLAIKSSYVYKKIWSKSNLSIIIQVQNKLTTNSGYKLFVFHIQTLENWALTYA